MEPLPSFQEPEQGHHPSFTGERSHLDLPSPLVPVSGQEGPSVVCHRSEVGTEKGRICLGWAQGWSGGSAVRTRGTELAEVRLKVRLTPVPPARLVSLRQAGCSGTAEESKGVRVRHEKPREFRCLLLVAAILSYKEVSVSLREGSLLQGECGIKGELCVCHTPSCARLQSRGRRSSSRGIRHSHPGGKDTAAEPCWKIPTAPPLTLGQSTSTGPTKRFLPLFCVLNHLGRKGRAIPGFWGLPSLS